MGLPSAVLLLLLTPRRPQPAPTTERNSPLTSATRQEALPVPGPLSLSMQPLPPCKSPSRNCQAARWPVHITPPLARQAAPRPILGAPQWGTSKRALSKRGRHDLWHAD